MEELARKKGVKVFVIDNLMMVDLSAVLMVCGKNKKNL